MNSGVRPSSLFSVLSAVSATVALAQPCSLDVNAYCKKLGTDPAICLTNGQCNQYELIAGQCLGPWSQGGCYTSLIWQQCPLVDCEGYSCGNFGDFKAQALQSFYVQGDC
jgi:hypothetical protein